MTQNNNILQELKELESSLAGLAAQNIYSVPDGYFEGLAGQVLNRIKAMEAANAAEELGYLSPILSNMSKQLPFTVPAGYFEGLEEKLMQTVRNSNDYQTATEELETLSPLLSGLKKEMPYSVPQGYFENLTVDINIPANKTETKVVSVGSRKWFRYAAAAVITGVIVMAGFMFIKNRENPQGQGLAKYEKKLNKEIKNMSDKELDDFLKYTDENEGLTGTENVSTNIDTDVKELLKDVPESELKEFLEETSDVELDTETSIMN